MSARIAFLITLVSVLLVGDRGAARAASASAAARRQVVLSDGWLVKQLDTGKPDVAALTRESASPDKSWLAARMPALTVRALNAEPIRLVWKP